ncbi:transcriptional regulator CynR [Rhodococcus sp. OK302]|uniref:transcriptional regulator CynR n=1 Tax=Rhodococcus sp. OK302 TaxID=1882769 RepID=UPI000B93B3D0|nr:transcriptional regulator CynR [Rhodococcus sp. OK302]OYD69953.1 LysR family cyn operon transcriptional activator [Rhodococcus sp. OK302]
MELRHIRYLLAVAEHQNFTRAAEALHVSQPTLSQQIKQLETALRVQLLDRSGRVVRTTDAGEAFLHYARRALRDLEAAERAIHDVQDLSRGSLRLATTPTFAAYLVGPLVDRFTTRHPGIAVTVQEMTQDRIEAELARDGLEIGIAFADVRSDEIESESLFVETLSLVVGEEHPRAGRRKPLAAKELDDQALVLLSSDFATRLHIDRYFKDQGITPRTAVEVSSIGAIVEIVRRGRLATVLPAAIALEQQGLFSIPLSPALPPRTVALLRRKGAYRTTAGRAFAEMASTWDDRDGWPG